ncbi:MAG: AAA family ATPase [Desulfobacterales bacterium]|nr:AAA family ATPase [Desulfobacterales bacterium]
MNGANQSSDFTGVGGGAGGGGDDAADMESRRAQSHERGVETSAAPMGPASGNGLPGPPDPQFPGTREPDPQNPLGNPSADVSRGPDAPSPLGIPSADVSRGPRSYTPKSLADQILTAKSAIEGERKVVTVMYTDVVNFTGMAEMLDPEDVHEIMDGCFKIIMDEVHNHQGTINQFTGDGVMALFGAPLALEAHAKKACQAALSIQKRIGRYSESPRQRFGLDFKMRVGLNTGPVVVGSIGDDLRMDYTAIGDTTNLASRLESMAKPGAVLISENTHKRIRGFFDFRPLGKVKIKGKTDLQEVYVLKETARGVESDPERGIRSHMVGRGEELDRLLARTRKVIDGEGSIVSIIGEAGIGKSRLLAELKKQAIMSRVTLLQGKAISIGRNLSFHPIIDMLKNAAGINDHDSMAVSREKLKAMVGRVCGKDADEVRPFVATLVGIRLSDRDAKRMEGIEGEALESLILKNVSFLLSRASERNPLVIVMEDLHWADESSLILLESLYSLTRSHRILLINLFRPEDRIVERGVIHTIKQDPSMDYVEITPRPLDVRKSIDLIDNMLNVKQLHPVVIDTIVSRSGGNPFFIEEVVRSFIDDGAIVMEDGQFVVTEKIDDVHIPYTINDVLMARIDRLEEKTRHLVKIASVIGRNFFYRVISDVAENVRGIDERLAYLKEIQLILERERIEELEYMFKHALAQEAAYDSILRQRRKEMHLMVADSIVSIFSRRPRDFYGVLAYHYSMGEDLEKAETYLVKAGEEALKSSASSEALHYYKNAMELYIKQSGDARDPDKMAALQQNIAIAFHNKGHYSKAVRYFDRALESLGRKKSESAFDTKARLAVYLLIILKNLLAPSVGKKIEPTPRDNQIMNIMVWRGYALVYLDVKKMFTSSIEATKDCFKFDIKKLDNGVKTLAGSMSLFSWTGISLRVCGMLSNYIRKNIDVKHDKRNHFLYTLHETIYHFVSGDFNKPVDEGLIEYGLKIGDIFSVSSYMIFQGWISIEQGDFAAADDLVRRLRSISEEYHHEAARGLFYELKLTMLMKKRKLVEALNIVDKGISHLSGIGENMRIVTMLAMKAGVLVMQNDIEGAEEALGAARMLMQREGAVPTYYLSNYWMGSLVCNMQKLKLAILANDKSKIWKYKSAALKSSKKARKNSRKVASARTRVYSLTGNYYWMIGKRRTALAWWRKSIAEGERLGARLALSRVCMSVGRRLSGPDSPYKSLNGIEAGDYLEKGRAMMKEMGLLRDLNQSDEEVWD